MVIRKPGYYDRFQCIAGACKDNCCIGWEIDIDEKTAEKYKNEYGGLGDRLRGNIEWGESPHFILGEGERCPFLNCDNLCDIICERGEDMLCSVCADHPRFRCELPGRIETGLGLCCEAAGALILGKKEPVTLEITGDAETADEIVELRDKILNILQNREKSIDARVAEVLSLCGSIVPEMTWAEIADFFLSLERLDEAWTNQLNYLKNCEADMESFAEYMKDRDTEYEQFLVYLIYRHFANAPDLWQMSARCAFAVFSYSLIKWLGALHYAMNGEFTFEDQVELCRLFSSEIEYSKENLYEVIELMY